MSKFNQFQYVNGPRKINRLIQICLAISFIIGLNYLATKHYWRKDLTLDKFYSLSAESKATISQISKEEPVTITVTLSPASNEKHEKRIFKYVNNLLKEYEYAGRYGETKKIVVNLVDLYRNKMAADRLVKKYKVKDPKMVLVECVDRHKMLSISDLVNLQDGELATFKGEQAITSALIEVTNANPKKIYFTTGHGEMLLENVDVARGISQLRFRLEHRGFELSNIEIANFPEIPDDAALIVIAAPLGPFHGREVELLRRYLDEQAGRVILLVGPRSKEHDHGLDDLLYEWSLTTDNMFVIDKGKGNLSSQGDLRIRQFAEHPITKLLRDNQLPIEVGLSRPVRQHPGAQADDRLELIPLMASSEESWGERSYHQGGLNFDEGVDMKGPVPLAYISERKVSPELGFDIKGGRLIVFGMDDLVANSRFSNFGNQALFINTVEWAIDQEKLFGIQPQQVRKHKLSLSQQEQIQFGFILISVPGFFALIGIFVYWARSS